MGFVVPTMDEVIAYVKQSAPSLSDERAKDVAHRAVELAEENAKVFELVVAAMPSMRPAYDESDDEFRARINQAIAPAQSDPDATDADE